LVQNNSLLDLALRARKGRGVLVYIRHLVTVAGFPLTYI